jgi:hypothetical protein
MDQQPYVCGTLFDPEQLSEHLADLLTWRQLRKLAKKNNLCQYSYLSKHGLAKVLAYHAFNRAARKQ